MNPLLQNINNWLRNINQLQPKVFTDYVQHYAKCGYRIHQEVINIIYVNFQTNRQIKQHRQKFIRIIDMLLQSEEYRHHIWKIVIYVYVNSFLQAAFEKNEQQMQLLKMLKQTWKNYLPENYPQEMRKIIYQRVNIDIQYIKPSYSRKFFKAIQKVDHFISNTPIHKKNYTLENIQINTKQNLDQLQISTNQPSPEREFLLNYPQKPGKRQRVHYINEELIERQTPLKVKKFDNSNILQIFRRLKKMHNFQCSKCGRFFYSQQNYSLHIHQHFLANQNTFQENKIKDKIKKNKNKSKRVAKLERPQLQTMEQWIGQDSSSSSQSAYVDSQVFMLQLGSQQSKLNDKCRFCGKQFQVVMDIDKWAYKKTLLADISSKKQLIHQECFKLANQ